MRFFANMSRYLLGRAVFNSQLQQGLRSKTNVATTQLPKSKFSSTVQEVGEVQTQQHSSAPAEEFEGAPALVDAGDTTKNPIEGKVALVTGGAAGIGLHYGRELLRNGAKAVMIADLNEEKGKEAIVELTDEFGPDKVSFVKTDVTDSNELEHAFRSSLNTWDRLDIVINNAAVMDDTKWEDEINVNCLGLTRGTLLGFEYMGKDKGGEGGTIVNIASALVFQKPGGCPIHVGTKFFTLGLGCSFGHYSFYNRTGVKMLTLCPGITATSMLEGLENKALNEETGALLKQEIENMPIQRPESVGQGLITVLQYGQPGSIWVCEGDDMVYEVEISTLESPQKQLPV